MKTESIVDIYRRLVSLEDGMRELHKKLAGFSSEASYWEAKYYKAAAKLRELQHVKAVYEAGPWEMSQDRYGKLSYLRDWLGVPEPCAGVFYANDIIYGTIYDNGRELYVQGALSSTREAQQAVDIALIGMGWRLRSE